MQTTVTVSLLQIFVLTAFGKWIDNSSKEERSHLEIPPRKQQGNLMTTNKICQGLEGTQLKLCLLQKTLKNGKSHITDKLVEEYKSCVTAKCHGRSGLMGNACAYSECGVPSPGLRYPLETPEVKKRWDDDFFWPDEMETRSADHDGTDGSHTNPLSVSKKWSSGIPFFGAQKTIGTLPEDTRPYLEGSPNGAVRRLLCPFTRCRGLSGSQLHLCYQRNCDGGNPMLPSGYHDPKADDDYKSCVTEKCHEHSGFMRDACAYWECTVPKPSSLPKPPAQAYPPETFSVNRRWDDDFFWPDEMETRSARETEAEGNDGNGYDVTRRMLSRFRKDVEHGDSVKIQGCSAVCEGFSEGKRRTKCLIERCSSKKHLSLQKRWSTRLCMEAHCKSASSKVDYFLCGKKFCH